MGRKKSTPVQNSAQGKEQENNEVLGRIAAEESVEELFEEGLNGSGSLPPLEGSSSPAGGPKNVHFTPSAIGQSRSPPKRPASLIDRLEERAIQEQKDREEHRRTKRQRKSPKKSPKKRIIDDTDTEGDDLGVVEVEIDAASNEPHQVTTLRIRNVNGATSFFPPTKTPDEDSVLATWKLSSTRILFTDSEKQPRNFNLMSTRGTEAVLRLCSSALSNADDTSSLTDVGKAVEQGTLYCRLHTSNHDGEHLVTVSIGMIPDRVLEAGDPAKVSLRQGKKQLEQPSAVLSRALSVLIPDSLMADVVRNPIKSSSRLSPDEKVSAKQVYAIVDNQQYTSTQFPQTLEINGLVPTLRPYQQAAVNWMLERETSNETGPEWKVVWIAVHATGHWEPLPSWSGEESSGNVLYHCPFTGWWVDTLEKARLWTLGDGAETNSTGGILAESMGLGKTVEVLACILANPRYPFQVSSDSSSLDIRTKTSISTSPPTAKTDITNLTASAPVDVSKTSGDSSSSEEEEFEFNGNLEDPPSSKEDPKPSASSTPTISIQYKTNDLEYGQQPLGVCICGHQILVTEKLDVVVCESCEEPMHAVCACTSLLDSKDKAPGGITYRYGVKSIDCRFCPEASCPCCVPKSEETIPSRATLIITPPAIHNQWQVEIEKHTSLPYAAGTKQPLKVVVYPGIKSLCNQESRKNLKDRIPLIHARILADADVVLMTFDALMGDINHSDNNPFVQRRESDKTKRFLRQRKIYRVVPSPLLSIQFWRVCLDEAQRVETPTAASAQMALKLNAIHRWCVSGTPLGSGNLEDLYGLLLFERIAPFCDKAWFTAAFQSSHRGFEERIFGMLQNIFWRSTKASPIIKEQMGLPEQLEKKTLLEFNSIERHFYQRQLEETLRAVTDVQAREKGGKKQSSAMLANVNSNMQRLRAACCHPQVGSNGLGMRQRGSQRSEVSGTLRILSMDQILYQLIEDARVKASEALRVAILHTNAMGALSRLKPEAKKRGFGFDQSTTEFLKKSYQHYSESLHLMDSNSTPVDIAGESSLTGSMGFQSEQLLHGGRASLVWRVLASDSETSKVAPCWARFDFEGSAKKIIEISIRHSSTAKVLPHEQSLINIPPKRCTLQVLSSIGVFVDVATFELSDAVSDESLNEWTTITSKDFCVSNRSKSWRLFMLDFHNVDTDSSSCEDMACSVEVRLKEAFVGSDSLQKLHCLENAADVFEELNENSDGQLEKEMVDRRLMMRKEASDIAKLYLEGTILNLQESKRRLNDAVSDLDGKEIDLFDVRGELPEGRDFWDDTWASEIVLMVSQFGSPIEKEELCRRVQEGIHNYQPTVFQSASTSSRSEAVFGRKGNSRPFTQFEDITGFYHALVFRLEDHRKQCPSGALTSCLRELLALSAVPDELRLASRESSTCERCKKDWTLDTGCAHCKLSIRLGRLEPNSMLLNVLRSIHSWMKGSRSAGKLALARAEAKVDQRASLFFDSLEACKRATSTAETAWRVHLTLLNEIDELSMCTSTMRLTVEGENLSDITDAELNRVVHPIDVASSFLGHEVKQASALANLRRHCSTLRYLYNQTQERQTRGEDESETCILCLTELENERRVLACGHFYCPKCFDRLLPRSSGNYISCPLRCAVRTKRDEVMTATESNDDSKMRINPAVKGSWGTKVTKLVTDLLYVTNRGEKSVVFTQWEDMMDVIEAALKFNNIATVRVTSTKKIAACTRRFRSAEYSVLLLNVKNCGEGLTLVEATHSFIMEPLLNFGLDLQAISRIHRLGQKRRTTVHRYLIKNTIEMKIDKLRMEHQGDELEEELQRSKQTTFKAGGIDGGFSSSQEVLDLLRADNETAVVAKHDD